MNKDRLRTLAEHLQTVKAESFRLDDWTCGTVACAVGHACSIPEFQAEGLSLYAYTLRKSVPSYQDERGWAAVSGFFDLSYSDATYLFSDQHYPDRVTPMDVADRIIDFIE